MIQKQIQILAQKILNTTFGEYPISPAALLTDFLKAISLGEPNRGILRTSACALANLTCSTKRASLLSIWRQIQVLLGRARAVRTRGQPFCT